VSAIGVFWVGSDIDIMDCSPLESCAPCVAASINGKGVLLEILS
jgi:hypothetical protein